MGKIKKRHTSGNAKNFITRTQAVKRLQLSLADFRRLCIFKGIYPREPRNKKKANKGSTAPVTFYYTKDIQYLLHEPILNKFREHKTFSKKLTRALGRGEVGDAKRLESDRPKYKLDKVIKERYPSFLDALRDIDDALNMLFLFSNMPATDKVTARVSGEANRLCNQWLAYVAKERVLKKVFVSIKGVYYSANVKGQQVLWLVPFKFPQNIPSDIDFRIMLTFLEFYSTLLHFVLFKLYTDSGLIYPPTIDENKLKGIGGLSAYILNSKDDSLTSTSSLLPDFKSTETKVSSEETKLSNSEISKAIKADKKISNSIQNNVNVDEDTEEQEELDAELDQFKDTNAKNSGDLLIQPSKYDNPVSNLFSNFTFYIGREVPLDILEFLILSSGGKIISEAAIDEIILNGDSKLSDFDFSNVTHHISDRPKLSNKIQGRTYIQPQWVFDSINKSTLLKVSDYAPGETLPPHLSPWGDSGNYDPEASLPQPEEGEEDVEDVEADPEADEDEDAESGEDEDEDEEAAEDEEEELNAQKELEKEVAGIYKPNEDSSSTSKKSKKRSSSSNTDKSAKEAKEEKDLKLIMMSNKQRKLYGKMQYGINKEDARKQELQNKKRRIEKTKSDLKKINKN
ncbi:unnamed protein product [[Candida] boidinii]|uniref:Pescadillo homolog n=1 Tax=Candida boidinii TaxID=5477 RepID=A0A9W6WIG0_CANBO|nr:hypothetical protein B5S30_g2870 [[Candida] boidinii]GME73423.1 unnamed protein product [[Candida] boidinii]GMG08450.1 unnamed protein product [[Candida] boidinii]